MTSVHLYTTLIIVICFPILVNCQSDGELVPSLTSVPPGLFVTSTSSTVEPTLSLEVSTPSSVPQSSANLAGVSISSSVEPPSLTLVVPGTSTPVERFLSSFGMSSLLSTSLELTVSPPSVSSISSSRPNVPTPSVLGVSSVLTSGPVEFTPSLLGVSSISTSGPLVPTPSLPGVSSISASGPLVPTPSLPGVSSLSASGPLVPTPSLLGVSSLSASGPLVPTPSLPGVSNISASGPLVPTPSLPGVSSLSASGPLVPTPSLPGVSSISASGPLVPTPSLPGMSSLSASGPLVPTPSLPEVFSLSASGPLVPTPFLPGVSSSSSVFPAAPTTSLQGFLSSSVGVQTTPTFPVSLTSNPLYTPPVLTPSSYSSSSVLLSTSATPLMSSAPSSIPFVSISSIPVVIQPSVTATNPILISSSKFSSSSMAATSSISLSSMLPSSTMSITSSVLMSSSVVSSSSIASTSSVSMSSSSSIITSSTMTTTSSMSMSSSEVSSSSMAATTSTTMSVPVITPQPTPCPACCPSMSLDPFMGYLFNWPQTKPQGQATAPCPCDRLPTVQDSLFAFRKCGNGSTWGPPDSSACALSTTFKAICTNNTSMDTSFLIGIAGQGKTLGDLVVIVTLANEFVSQQKDQETVLKVVDGVLGDTSEDLLKNASKYTGTPNSILQLVDNFAAQATPGPYYNYDSFKLLVNSVNTSSSSNELNIGDNVAVIPQSVFNKLNLATVRVSSASFSKESLFSGGNDSLGLATDVLSVTIIGKKVTDLQEKVKLIFRKLPLQGVENSAVCSYWKVSETSGHLGDWSEDGCSLAAENSTHITCECDHLSAFAALKIKSRNQTPSSTDNSTIIIIAVCVSLGIILIISLIVIICIVVVCCYRCRRKKSWGALTISLRDKGSEYETLHNETVIDFISSTM